VKKDPLKRLRRHLDHLGYWSDAEDAALETTLNQEIAAAITEVEKHGPPPRETLFDDVHAEMPWHLREQKDELMAGPPAPKAH